MPRPVNPGSTLCMICFVTPSLFGKPGALQPPPDGAPMAVPLQGRAPAGVLRGAALVAEDVDADLSGVSGDAVVGAGV